MTKMRFRSNLPLLRHHPWRFVRTYWVPLTILLIGGTLDAITTWESLGRHGPEVELHPGFRMMLRIFGTSPAVVSILKTVQVLAAVFVAALWDKWTSALMVLCGVLYTLAAVSNHYQWF